MTPVDLIGIEVPARTLDLLARDLAKILRVSCRVRPESLDISVAWNASRGQYCSTVLLSGLRAFDSSRRVLGVTSVDLFVPVLTFVFGEAQLAGNCAIVSGHRLDERFYGLPARAGLFHERLMKEAVHELGHTCGLRHCDDWRCVMASSHSVELIDVKTVDFCAACQRVVMAARNSDFSCSQPMM